MDVAQFQLNAEIEQRHWWFVARRRIVLELARAILPPAPDAWVADVGCGTGGNTIAFAEEYPAIGIDPSPEAIALARRAGSAASFRCGRVPEDLADVIPTVRLFLLMDVIEHVPDDFALLSGLLASASPGCHVIITVPADPALWSGHDESHGHYRRYTRARLCRLWRDLPVEALLVSHFNTRLEPLVRGVRAWNRRRGGTFGRADTDLQVPIAPVNRALGGVFAGERSVLLDCLRGTRGRGYDSGVSLLAVLRRGAGDIVPETRPADVEPDLHDPARGAGEPGRPMTRLVLVVPCYNEARRLDVEAFKSFDAGARAMRFLFVNDGSTDDTADVLRSLTAIDAERYAVLDLPRNVGKAEAVRQGMLHALEDGPDLVGFWDADLATPLETIGVFCELLETRSRFELVMGSRVQLMGRAIEHRVMRHYAGRAFATAASIVLGLRVYDTQCGAKLFRATPELAGAIAEAFGSRWIFDVELLARLIRDRRAEADRMIYEHPLERWHDVAGSKLRPTDAVGAFVDLLKIHRRYRS